MKKLLIVAGSLAILSACGGSDYDAPRADTSAPTIESLADVNLEADQSSDAISISVEDNRTATASIALTVSSSNSALVSDQGLVLTDGDLVVTPESDSVGEATITVNASDAVGNSSSTSFTIIVAARELSDTGLVNEIVLLDEDSEPVFVNQLSISELADSDTGFDALLDD